MATLEREFSARWGVDEVFRYFRDGILAGSQSVTDGGGSVYETEGARFIVRVFERFSLTDQNLVSLSLLLADLGDGRIRLTGITAGCGRLEKLWTYGEEAFLKKLTKHSVFPSANCALKARKISCALLLIPSRQF